MTRIQPGILAPIPPLASHLFFRIAQPAALGRALQTLREAADGTTVVAGFGLALAHTLGISIPGLRAFPEGRAGNIAVPSTPWDVWLWLRGDDRGALFDAARQWQAALAPALQLAHAVDGFRYKDGHDLTGYEDGTENPEGDAAVAAAGADDQGPGLDGSSFVAVQQWRHDFKRFDAMARTDQDDAIGRRLDDNEELDDAPASAHVKRTAQESFDPEAFLLRRSMPWSENGQAGLLFVACGKSFDAFEAQLRRMNGADDGIVDALYRFTCPISGAYFWCPPMSGDGQNLDLSALGY